MRSLILAFAMAHICTLDAEAQNPISRAQMVANGESYDDANYIWQGYTANISTPWLGGSCGGRNVYCAKSPNYGHVVDGTNYGMPYCWGAWSTFSQHKDAMSGGKSGGDVCSYTGGDCDGNGAGLLCSSGMDCSGFVGRAWDWPDPNPNSGGIHNKPGTSTLAGKCIPIKGQFVRMGDIYDKIESHVVMAIAPPPSSNRYAQIIESSMGRRRVKKGTNIYQLSNYEISGYTAYVYNNKPSCGPAPSGLTGTKTSTSITINWTNSNGSTGEVYYRKSTESKYSLVQQSISSWPYTLSGLTPNTKYYIKVSKTCSDGSWGISSQTLVVTTDVVDGLNCNNAIPLSNNVPYNGSNNGSGNSVSTYGCIGYTESGPEKVHSYYHPGGIMTVNFTHGAADLDAFILGSCDQNDCLMYIDYGQDAINLPSGTYYIVIDGYNGAMGSYTLKVSSGGVGNGAANLTDNGSSKSVSGRNITITVKVKNNGQGDAGPFETWFWLSTDLNFNNGNDYVWAYVSYEGLQANGTHQVSGTLPAPSDAPAGTYYILEWIDYYGQINESNENDNYFYIGPSFYLPPNLHDPSGERTNVVGIVELKNDGTFHEVDPSTKTAFPIVLGQSQIRTQPVPVFCTTTVSGFQISATQLAENSEYVLSNALGQITSQGKNKDGNITINVNSAGIYFLSIIDGMGNKCVQKIFVN